MKSNIEMIAECIDSISRGKDLPVYKAYKYLARAIFLAKEQKMEVNRLFFLNGDYTSVRPTREADERHKTLSQIDAESERFHQHGCHSGWVYEGAKVRRCQKCVEGK